MKFSSVLAIFTALVLGFVSSENASASIFEKLGYDFEVGGRALSNWIHHFVDLKRVEETIPWRNRIKNKTRGDVLLLLDVEDPKVYQSLPEHIQKELFSGLELKTESAPIIHHHLSAKAPVILGQDGLPYQPPTLSALTPELKVERPSIYIPEMKVESAQIISAEQQKIINEQKVIQKAIDRREVIQKRWAEITSHPESVNEIFNQVPLSAYGPNEKAFLVKLSSYQTSIVTMVKPDLKEMQKVEIGTGSDTLELRGAKPFTDQEDFEEQLFMLSNKIGTREGFYLPGTPGSERNAALHIHFEIRNSILPKDDLKVFMKRYRVKNAIEASFYKEDAFKAGTNGLFQELEEGKGNVSMPHLGEPFHYELRELPYTPKQTLNEFKYYFEGLESLPEKERLPIALKRLNQKLAETISLHPAEFKRSFDEIKEIHPSYYQTPKSAPQAQDLSRGLLSVMEEEHLVLPGGIQRIDLFHEVLKRDVITREVRQWALRNHQNTLKNGGELFDLTHNHLVKQAFLIQDGLKKTHSPNLNPELYQFYESIYSDVLTPFEKDAFTAPRTLFASRIAERLKQFTSSKSLLYNFKSRDLVKNEFVAWRKAGFHQEVDEAAERYVKQITDDLYHRLDSAQSIAYAQTALSLEGDLGVELFRIPHLFNRIKKTNAVALNQGTSTNLEFMMKNFHARKFDARACSRENKIVDFIKRIF